MAADVVVEDHRLLGWETVHGAGDYVRTLHSLVDLAPDTRVRLDHVEMSQRGLLWIGAWVGTREGGAFETPWITVSEHDARGVVRRFDQYDLNQLASARARFVELATTTTARDPLAALVKPNAATAAMDRIHAAFEAGDWQALRAQCAPAMTSDDRRRHVLFEVDLEQWIADWRDARAQGMRLARRIVGTAGDRIALERMLFSGPSTLLEGGPFEIEHLTLNEVDDQGRIAASITFDLDDRRAAFREAHERWLAIDPAAAAAKPGLELEEANNDRDRARMRAVLADDVVVHDRRLVGTGVSEGADAVLETIKALWELAPDIQHETLSHLAVEHYGSVPVMRSFGTTHSGGGAFERLMVIVSIATGGRITWMEYFDIEQADAALARLAELRPDPLRIPPNAATAAFDRVEAARAKLDWEAMRALCAPHMVYDERRRLVRTTGDREMFVANARLIAKSESRLSRTLLATAGDRLALERFLYTGTRDGGPFEIEALCLTEVDAEGAIVAVISPADRRAAFDEMSVRFAAGEGADAPRSLIGRAFNDHDWETHRDCFAPDTVVHDHRPLSLGVVTRDEYTESARAWAELAPDVGVEVLRIFTWNRHGRVFLSRAHGTVRDGGPFENFFVGFHIVESGRICRYELFPADAVDEALARFTELCAERE
jgi:ketosteroid isomerase-like protein